MIAAVGGTLLLAVVLTIAPLIAPTHLPEMLGNGARWTGLNEIATGLALACWGISIILIVTSLDSRSELFHWFAVAQTALCAANILSLIGGGRYTAGWMMGRISWLVSASVLFIYFLGLHMRQQRQLAQTVSDRTAELRTAEAAMAAIVSSTSEAIFSQDRAGTITSWNRAAELLFGYSAAEMIGRPAVAIIPSARQAADEELIGRITEGERIDTFETERLDRHGQLIPVALTASPLIIGHRLTGISNILHDIRARKRREYHNALLLREVNHRSKNLLAVVQAMARQTNASTPDTFLESFTDRLDALAASHDLLIESQWKGVDLDDLVRAELERFDELIGTRIAIYGPSTRLSAQASQTIGMALYELATNAGKYGALSDGTGQLRIAWRVEGRDQAARLVLDWIERGGPAVLPPSHRGFGTTLICDVPKAALKADIDLCFDTAGLSWSMAAPSALAVDNTPD